mmetsp:Transcript_4273/g.9183  ORF Transcript_4273/g.9183 Transcript_4273/m.9183 type:complete len:207 (-) Transcript_4273:1214-1834(-)
MPSLLYRALIDATVSSATRSISSRRSNDTTVEPPSAPSTESAMAPPPASPLPPPPTPPPALPPPPAPLACAAACAAACALAAAAACSSSSAASCSAPIAGPCSRSSFNASTYERRSAGREKRRSSNGYCARTASISRLHRALRPSKMEMNTSSSRLRTSWYDSLKVISRSRPTNSVMWRWVNDFSERKTGPISNTRPRSAISAICL